MDLKNHQFSPRRSTIFPRQICKAVVNGMLKENKNNLNDMEDKRAQRIIPQIEPKMVAIINMEAQLPASR